MGHDPKPAQGRAFTTAELKTNGFTATRPADELSAVGRPLHIGRRTQVWDVGIRNREHNAAFFTCTQMVLEAG